MNLNRKLIGSSKLKIKLIRIGGVCKFEISKFKKLKLKAP